jgi:hypothetical protein
MMPDMILEVVKESPELDVFSISEAPEEMVPQEREKGSYEFPNRRACVLDRSNV